MRLHRDHQCFPLKYSDDPRFSVCGHSRSEAWVVCLNLICRHSIIFPDVKQLLDYLRFRDTVLIVQKYLFFWRLSFSIASDYGNLFC